MLGEDTLFYTKNGFKKLKNLNKYDEVLNSDGHFTYITRLGPWKPINKCVKLSTSEEIYCDDSLLWDLSGVGEFKYTDELELYEAGISCARSCELERVRPRKLENNYEKSVRIPRNIPHKYITCKLEDKLEFLAGLIDSPMCELGDHHGIYVFSTYFEDFAHELVALARSIGYGVMCRYVPKYKIYVIRIYIDKYIDILPIRDPYKVCFREAGNSYTAFMLGIRKIEPAEANFGRTVELNDGNCLVGYSLVSVY